MMEQFGIWEFDANYGLVGRPENLPELYLGSDKLWEIEETTSGQVWRWPVHLASNKWFTPSVADDFNKAFFYAQDYMKRQRPENLIGNFEYNARTIQLQTELLTDYFQESDEEITAE